VDKSYIESPVLSGESIRENLILGLEQARDTILPAVQIRTLFKPFAEDELPGIIKGSLAIAAHPAAEKECPRAVQGPVTLALGPEGGFIPFEIETLASAGFMPAAIGPRILRTEFALPSLIGRLF
ncbi:MAG: RsmE family RNA methyltransferase, partial [Spirochaetota bacterium]